MSTTNQSKKSVILSNPPLKSNSDNVDKSNQLSSEQRPKDGSPTDHQFQCSRARASHIAQWVSNVNSNGPDSESLIGTEWKQDVHTKKIKKKKKKKRKMPVFHERSSTETNSTERPILSQNTPDSSKVSPTSISASNIPELKSEETKSLRPPLKKVNHKNKSANKAPQSPSKVMSSSFTPNLFTPFSQFTPHIQDKRNDFQATPMNIDSSSHRFSTPFMKSPPPTGPQDLLSSPINMNMPSNETPNFFANITKQQEFENLQKIDTSSDIHSMNEQRDSGFDEVIDMDIDNFEEMTQLIKAEVKHLCCI